MNSASESKPLENQSSDKETLPVKISKAVFYTSEVYQKPAMLLGTESNAAKYFALYSSAETKTMHHGSRHSSDFPESLLVPHISSVISGGTAVISQVECQHPWQT